MNDELKKKLLKEIEKSGIPLELKTAAAFQEAGWYVQHPVRFTRRDEGETELDVVAASEQTKRQAPLPDLPGLDLIVECKSSRKRPWVFFGQPKHWTSKFMRFPKPRYISAIPFRTDSGFLDLDENSELCKHHYYSVSRRSRHYFEAFGKDGGNDIYKAIQTLWAGIEWREQLLQDVVHRENPIGIQTKLVHGVIVFDGVLAFARSRGSEFQIEEAEHILLQTNISQPGFMSSSVDEELNIDVVHADFLENYVDLCGSDLNVLNRHLADLRQRGRSPDPHG